MALIIIAVLIGLLPAAIAQSKGRNFFLWWFYGAMLWIIALPHALLMSSKSRPCPHCAEKVQNEAKACPHCQRDLLTPTNQREVPTKTPVAKSYERPDAPFVHENEGKFSPQTSSSASPYDRRKWEALVQYDADISSAAQEVGPLGSKWLDELASAYMALGDKIYLPSIVEKIQARAAEEAERSLTSSETVVESHEKPSALQKQNLQLASTEPTISEATQDINGAGMWILAAIFVLVAFFALFPVAMNWYSPSTAAKTAGDKPATPAQDASPKVLASMSFIVGLDANGDNWLALRSEPSGSKGIRTAKLSPETAFVVLGRQSNWSHVRLSTGQEGWVSSKFVGCCTMDKQALASTSVSSNGKTPVPPQNVQDESSGTEKESSRR